MTGDEQSPAELADAAYEAVRAFNHATMPWAQSGHEDPYRVLGSLAALLRITPQALRQAAACLNSAERGRRLAVDSTSPLEAVAAVVSMERALNDAASAVARAARHVDAAHEAAAHLIIDPLDQPRM